MINNDFSDLSTFRSDGRKFNELRTTSINLGFDTTAEGSCHLKQGQTEVICLVQGPYHRKGSEKQGIEDQLLNIEYTVAPFSSIQRKQHSKFDKDFSQFAQNIRRSFQSLICCQLYSKSYIDVIVTLIQNDGSSKSSILNCITLALINAGIAMRDFLVSVTVAHKHYSILDLTTEETYEFQNQLILSFIPGKQQIDYIELKQGKINRQQLSKLTNLAIEGCNTIYERMRKILMQTSLKQLFIR